MATTLPRAGASSVGSGSVRKAALPDAGDVPTVNPVRDPGLTVPDQGAVGRGLQDLGAGLDDFGQSLAAADDRIKTRQEALDRMRIKTALREKLRLSLESADDTGDLSAEGNLEALGAEGRSFVDEAIASHGGRPDSQAQLALDLEQEFRGFSDKGATRANDAGDARAQAIAGEFIDEGYGQALNGVNPNDLIDRFMRDHMSPGSDLKASMRPGDDIAVIQRFQRSVVTGSLDRLFAAGDAESINKIEESMGDPAVQRALGADGQRATFKRLDAIKRDQSAIRTQPVKGIPRDLFDSLAPSQQAQIMGGAPSKTTIKGIPESVFNQMSPVEQRRFLGVEEPSKENVKGMPRDIYDSLTPDAQQRVLGAEPDKNSVKGIPEDVFDEMSTEQQERFLGTAGPEQEGAAVVGKATAILGTDPTPEQRERLADVDEKTPLVTVGAEETAFQKGLGKGEAEEILGLRENAKIARRQKPEIERATLAIESGRFTPGVFSDVRVFLARLAEFVGADENVKGLLGDAATADTLDAASARLGIDVAKKVGRVTNMSLTFVKDGLPSLSRTPEGNMIILEVMDRTTDREIEIAALAETYLNRYGKLRPEGQTSFFEAIADLDKEDPVITEELRERIIEGSRNAKKEYGSFSDLVKKVEGAVGGESIPTFSTPEEVYDKSVPSGTEYIWAGDGKKYRKN